MYEIIYNFQCLLAMHSLLLPSDCTHTLPMLCTFCTCIHELNVRTCDISVWLNNKIEEEVKLNGPNDFSKVIIYILYKMNLSEEPESFQCK